MPWRNRTQLLESVTGVNVYIPPEVASRLPEKSDGPKNVYRLYQVTEDNDLEMPVILEDHAFAKVSQATGLVPQVIESLSPRQRNVYGHLVSAVAACAIPRLDDRIDLITDTEVTQLQALATQTLPGMEKPLGAAFLYDFAQAASIAREELMRESTMDQYATTTASDLFRQVIGSAPN
jgi:hypothetical protein